MAKIKTIGNKKDILKERVNKVDWEKLVGNLADKTDRQVTNFIKKYFSGLPDETRAGIEIIVRVLWANSRVTKKLWLGK